MEESKLLRCPGDIWRFFLFSFKPDSPEEVILLLCWCMCKLHTEFPEISRIRYCVCVLCMFVVCREAACLLPKRSLNTGRERRKNCSPRSSAVYNTIYIPTPTDNLHLRFPQDPFIDDLLHLLTETRFTHTELLPSCDERSDNQGGISFSGVRGCIIIKSMISSLVSRC